MFATHPFFVAAWPAGQVHGPLRQMCFRRSDSGVTGRGAGSLQGPSMQMCFRRSDSVGFRSPVFSGGFSPMRGAPTIRFSPEILRSGITRSISLLGASGFAEFTSRVAEFETPEEVGLGAT